MSFRCKCGGQLSLVKLLTYEKNTIIKKDGKPYLSHINLTEYLDFGDSIAEKLVCWECDDEYEYLGLDEEGKVLKGEKLF